MKYKRIFTMLLFTGIGVITYWTIFQNHDIGTILFLIRGLNGNYVIAAVAVALFFVASEGFMIWYLLPADKSHTGILKCVKYSFIGFFFSGITPSATGGQPVQLLFMKKDGRDLAGSAAVLMSVAVVYKFVLVIIGAGLLLFWRSGITEYLGSYRRLYDVGLALNMIVLVLLLGAMLFPALLIKPLACCEKCLIRLRMLRPNHGRFHKIKKFIVGYEDAVAVFKRNPGKIAVVIGATFLQRSSMFFLTWLIYRAFHLSGTGCLTMMALRASVYIAVDMLPLPGSQGITELMYEAVFRDVFSAGILPAALCVTRGVDFYLLICISAAVFLWNVREVKRKPDIIEKAGSGQGSGPACAVSGGSEGP